jgi:nucleoside-diphosphate-sugar epimerase
MKILLTGAASPLGRALTEELRAARHPLVLLDSEPVALPEGARDVALGLDLTDADAVSQAVRGVDAVVHTAEAPADAPTDGVARDEFLLDYRSRGTHVLFKAAVEAGVRRFVYGSSLDLFRAYPDNVYISEMWRPKPTPDMEPLSRWLGELVCREFSRDFLVTVTALRLGQLALEEEVVGQAPDPMWLDRRDAVRAFVGALERDSSDEANASRRWSVMHLCHTPPNPRFVSSDRVRPVAEVRHHFAAAWQGDAAPVRRPCPLAGPATQAQRPKRVLFLGASGLIGPYLTPGLGDYELTLADIKDHPEGVPVQRVDVTDYEQVLAAARGHDAVMNYTVVRGDPDLSFHVSVRGAWNVMRAAAELGIGKVLHSGPEYVRPYYDHDFDIDNPPDAPGTGWYSVTKLLSREICRVWARTYGIITPTFLFNLLGEVPAEAPARKDFHPFFIVWPDLQHACRLALDLESLPATERHTADNYEEFHLHSHEGQGKFSLDRPRRVLGYEPTQDWTELYRRPT